MAQGNAIPKLVGFEVSIVLAVVDLLTVWRLAITWPRRGGSNVTRRDFLPSNSSSSPAHRNVSHLVNIKVDLTTM